MFAIGKSIGCVEGRYSGRIETFKMNEQMGWTFLDPMLSSGSQSVPISLPLKGEVRCTQTIQYSGKEGGSGMMFACSPKPPPAPCNLAPSTAGAEGKDRCRIARASHLPVAVSVPFVSSADQDFEWAVRGARDGSPIPISRPSYTAHRTQTEPRQGGPTGRFYVKPISRSRSGDGQWAWGSG